MKAILVSVANKNRKVCQNVQEAIYFLKSEGVFVNEKSSQHLELGFNLINVGEENKRGGHGYAFAAGNNSNNPSIYLDNVTELYSIAEMSPENIKKAVSEVESELQKKQSDFKLSAHSSIIEGGFNWYYVQSNQRHYAVHELWVKSTEFATIKELKFYLLEKGNDLISKYGK